MPTYRIYYNRTAEQPTVWSVDEGTQASEINVSSFQLHKVNAESQVDLSVVPNRNTPTAWIQVTYATLEVKDGVAHLFHDSRWRAPRLL